MRKSAARALGNLGEHAASAVPALTKYLEHHLFYVRSSAADALGNLGEHAASAVPGMTKCLEVSRRTLPCGTVWNETANFSKF